MAFEGLNQAGYLKRDLIVVLNDNEMSISPNVGAMGEWLSKKFTSRTYNRWRKGVKEFLEKLPKGHEAIDAIRHGIAAAKALVTPGVLFEGLGFHYVGPVDGHDVAALVETFQKLAAFGDPVLLHVITQKGKGYHPAESDPATRGHGLSFFDVATGKSVKKPARQGLHRPLRRGAHRGDAGATTRWWPSPPPCWRGPASSSARRRFPERTYDVGIAEQHAVTFAAGLACEGIRPVVAIYSTFLQRAYDQIIHDVALQKLPVTFALDRGGLVGADGKTHQGAFDLSYLRCIPNLVVMAPSDEDELRDMLHTALQPPRPVRLPLPARRRRWAWPCERPAAGCCPIGKGRVVRAGGATPDVLVVAAGATLAPALAAAEELAARRASRPGSSTRASSSRSTRRSSAARRRAIGRVVTVEENALAGGFGAACLEAFEARGLLAGGLQVKRLGIPDRFITHAEQPRQRAEVGIDAPAIVAACRALCGARHGPRRRPERAAVARRRIDLLLVERGLAESRAQAQALVMAGAVVAGEARVDKPGPAGRRGAAAPAQGRRGAAALRLARRAQAGEGAGGLPGLAGRPHLRRPGGLDRRLHRPAAAARRGAGLRRRRRLRPAPRPGSARDPRVVVRERENARALTAEALGERVDLVVGDLSFISLRLVLPAVKAILKPGGWALLLVKPQFEVGKGEVGKGGRGARRLEAAGRARGRGGGGAGARLRGAWATPRARSRGRPGTASGCWGCGGDGAGRLDCRPRRTAVTQRHVEPRGHRWRRGRAAGERRHHQPQRRRRPGEDAPLHPGAAGPATAGARRRRRRLDRRVAGAAGRRGRGRAGDGGGVGARHRHLRRHEQGVAAGARRARGLRQLRRRGDPGGLRRLPRLRRLRRGRRLLRPDRGARSAQRRHPRPRAPQPPARPRHRPAPDHADPALEAGGLPRLRPALPHLRRPGPLPAAPGGRRQLPLLRRHRRRLRPGRRLLLEAGHPAGGPAHQPGPRPGRPGGASRSSGRCWGCGRWAGRGEAARVRPRHPPRRRRRWPAPCAGSHAPPHRTLGGPLGCHPGGGRPPGRTIRA